MVLAKDYECFSKCTYSIVDFIRTRCIIR